MPLNDQQKSALELLDAAFPDGYVLASREGQNLTVYTGNSEYPFGMLCQALANVSQNIGHGFMVAPMVPKAVKPSSVNVPGMGKGRLLSS